MELHFCIWATSEQPPVAMEECIVTAQGEGVTNPKTHGTVHAGVHVS